MAIMFQDNLTEISAVSRIKIVCTLELQLILFAFLISEYKSTCMQI